MAKGSRNRERDQKDLWNENRALRRQIKSLQREVNGLRKELGKAASYTEDQEDRNVEDVKPVKLSKPQCSGCGSYEVTLLPVEINKKKVIYVICQSCGLRTKAQST